MKKTTTLGFLFCLLCTVVPGGTWGSDFSISSATFSGAPDGTGNDRRTIGVGEVVQFNASARADWEVQGASIAPNWGTPTQVSDQTSFTWQSPDVPGTFTIIARPSPASGLPFYDTRELVMTVIVPTAVRLRNGKDWTGYTAGFAGVGFTAIVHLLPKSVSFGDIETKEDTAPPIVTGYFERPGRQFTHPAGPWTGTDDRNRGGSDDANIGLPGFAPDPGPDRFKRGTHRWAIPWLYQTVDGLGTPRKFLDLNQIFTMADRSGMMTVGKGGWAAVRTP